MSLKRPSGPQHFPPHMLRCHFLFSLNCSSCFFYFIYDSFHIINLCIFSFIVISSEPLKFLNSLETLDWVTVSTILSPYLMWCQSIHYTSNVINYVPKTLYFFNLFNLYIICIRCVANTIAKISPSRYVLDILLCGSKGAYVLTVPRGEKNCLTP